MEERIDVLDEKTGDLTGEVISKSEAHKTGKWHGSIHILIVNKDGTKTLLQKRCAQKKLYPNMWDIAVGGHISAGETALLSAQRELQEELGIDCRDFDMQAVDRIKEQLTNNGIISNEYVTIYLVRGDIDISKIKLQEEEVSEVKWCSQEELNYLISNKLILPHVREYEILNELLSSKEIKENIEER